MSDDDPSRPTSVIHLRMGDSEELFDDDLRDEFDAPVLTTSRSASFSVDLLEPPGNDRYQSHIPGTFAPGATCQLLIFPDIKGLLPSQRWRNLRVRLTGTSEVRPFKTLPTLHTVLRIHKEVPLAATVGGGEPIAVSCEFWSSALVN